MRLIKTARCIKYCAELLAWHYIAALVNNGAGNGNYLYDFTSSLAEIISFANEFLIKIIRR